MSFAITRFLRVTFALQAPMQSSILGPKSSENLVFNIQTSAVSSCVSPISIPRGENVRVFAKISFQSLLFKISTRTSSILIQTLNDSCSKTRRRVLARLSQFFREVHVLPFRSILIWVSLHVLKDIKSGKLK